MAQSVSIRVFIFTAIHFLFMFNTFLFLLYFKEKIDLYQGTQLVLLNVNSRNSSNHELSVYQLNSTNQSLFQFIISNKLLDLI